MMKIEKYIEVHKEKLDMLEPDISGMWGVIHQELSKKKIKRMLILRWAAASLLVFIVVGALVRHEIIVQQQITSLSQINEALAQKELLYHQQVHQKWNEYHILTGNPSPLEPQLLEELQTLDTLYQNGMTDISEKGYNERAIIILLETYEQRLRIIEQLIYEKQKQERYEKRNQKYEI